MTNIDEIRERVTVLRREAEGTKLALDQVAARHGRLFAKWEERTVALRAAEAELKAAEAITFDFSEVDAKVDAGRLERMPRFSEEDPGYFTGWKDKAEKDQALGEMYGMRGDYSALEARILRNGGLPC